MMYIHSNNEIDKKINVSKIASRVVSYEKVRPWCGQPSDRGRLKNTEQCVIDNVHSNMTRPSRLPLSQVS